VPDGYICIRVDARGSGNSPGFLNPKSVRETQDMYQCIEWAAVQSWSSGKVGLNGISYYATNQWYVASMQPPHLAAMCVWEGAADYYRDNTHHGGILCQFLTTLYPWAVWRVQNGVGENGPRSRANGTPVGGRETLSREELLKNRIDIEASLLAHPLDAGELRALVGCGELGADGLRDAAVAALRVSCGLHQSRLRCALAGHMVSLSRS
jgi:predicted acyl esterase